METPTTPTADRFNQIEANVRELGRLAGVSTAQMREGWKRAQPAIVQAGIAISQLGVGLREGYRQVFAKLESGGQGRG